MGSESSVGEFKDPDLVSESCSLTSPAAPQVCHYPIEGFYGILLLTPCSHALGAQVESLNE